MSEKERRRVEPLVVGVSEARKSSEEDESACGE